MHDQWNSGSMRVYRLLVQDYHASRMHARWQHLIYFFTGCHHQHRAFNLRFSLHESFYRHFPLQEFFRFFSHQPVLYFSLLHPTNAFVFGSNSLSDKVELLYASRSASKDQRSVFFRNQENGDKYLSLSMLLW